MKRNKITSRVFLKHDFYAPHTLHCAVDEKDKWVYILYDSKRELAVEVDRFPLGYEKPDKLGYRRISVPMPNLVISDPVGCSFVGDPKKIDVSVTAINFFPSTGELILHSKNVIKKTNQIGFFPRLRDWLSKIEVPMLNGLQSYEMEDRSHVFCRSHDMLVLISYHDRHPPVNAEDRENRNIDRKEMVGGQCMILYSYDAQLKPINTLLIDPVELVGNFLPKTLFDDLKLITFFRMPDFMFFGAHLQLLGEVHKYVLFFFHHNYVFAAKWPKNWYKLQQMPKVHQKRVICVDKQMKHGQIRDVWLLSTDLFFKVEKSGVEAIRKMSLGHKFKDYRKCAFCGKEEEGKRKNKHGKRVSNFKVCRLCKELDLHKSNKDTSPRCHYCSLECVHKHWKEHKRAHRGARNQSK